jgi:hypothetical protein
MRLVGVFLLTLALGVAVFAQRPRTAETTATDESCPHLLRLRKQWKRSMRVASLVITKP